MFDIAQIIAEGLTYDAIKIAVGSAMASVGATFIVGKLLRKLENKREAAYFFIASFVFIFVLVFIIAPRTQGPQLGGNIQAVTGGGINNDHDTITVITVAVLNSGSMQSITKNWSITAKVNENTYDGSFLTPPPNNFAFNLKEEDARDNGPQSPTGIVYHAEDSMLDKAINPIAPGGMMEGILFVLFRGVDPSVFKGGANYVVGFEDVLGRKYTFQFATSAKKNPFTTVAGLHTDMVCPAPPNISKPNSTPVPNMPKL